MSVCQDPALLVTAEARQLPQAVLLDEELPGCIGALEGLREVSDVPILLMSLSYDDAAVAALKVGADGVIRKPFSGDLLLAYLGRLVKRVQHRPRPQMRRGEGQYSSEGQYNCADLCLDFDSGMVTVGGTHIRLSRLEYLLLEVLANNAGRVLTHSQLLGLVWGPGYDEKAELLRGTVRNLRKRLMDDARSPRFISTHEQAGYSVPRENTTYLRERKA
jgi:two-component system KDP operon response regulator KdpE